MSLPKAYPTFELTKQEFESLLRPHLGSEVTVEKFTSRALTQPGENYGSTILAVELTLQQDNNKKKVLPVVVKLVPPSQFLREIFDIEITFNKEVNAYRLVSPAYEWLQKEKGIPCEKFLDIFPKFYGARTNKQGDSSSKADDTAVLILENLKISGYVTGDRINGLDLKHTQLTISQLASFHATSVALKILKPELFKQTVRKACESFILDGVADDEVAEKIITSTVDDLKRIPECLPYLRRIEKALRDDMKVKKDPSLLLQKEPFATFVHNDFWVNNMMFKYQSSGDQRCDFEIPTNMKFVDFQTTIYASPIHDLIFFLYSSIADDVLENYFDHLINLYHREFISCLSDLKCNTEPFSFKRFEDELNTFAPKEFVHVLCMIKFIVADKNKVPDLSNCDVDVIVQQNYGGERFEKRVKFLIQDFVKKSWL